MNIYSKLDRIGILRLVPKVLLLFVFLSLLTGCSNRIPNAIDVEGTWGNSDGVRLSFFEDGTCSITNMFHGLLYGSAPPRGKFKTVSTPRSNCTWKITPNEKLYGYYSGIHMKFKSEVDGYPDYVVGFDSTERAYPVLTQMTTDDKYIFQKQP